MGILGKIFKSDDENAMSVDGSIVTKTTADKGKIEKQGEEKVVTSSKKGDPSAYRFLVQPLITEKATDLVAQNKYCFIVPVNVNKTEVAKRIKSVYGVKPTKVNFVQVIGKKVRTGRRIGKRKDFKKAIITLNKEDKIELYEGV